MDIDDLMTFRGKNVSVKTKHGYSTGKLSIKSERSEKTGKKHTVCQIKKRVPNFNSDNPAYSSVKYHAKEILSCQIFPDFYIEILEDDS